MNIKYIILCIIIITLVIIIYKNRDKILKLKPKRGRPPKKIDSCGGELCKSRNINGEKQGGEKRGRGRPRKNIVNTDLNRADCFLDIYISPEEGVETQLGVLKIKLYKNIVPKTCNNFESLCKVEYKNCVIHRLIPGFMVQTGDYENGDGTGGKSIEGEKFDDENLSLKHNRRGLLSMANSGPNTNGSQFFITFGKAEHLDGKHVIFGEIADGFSVLDKIEKIQTDETDAPIPLLYIKNSGIIN